MSVRLDCRHLDCRFRPQRILIVQFGSARELVKTIPLTNALRLRFPRAEIAWFSEPEIVELLNNYSIVDRMIIAKRDWYKKRGGLKSTARRLRAFAPDLCFDLHGTFLSGMVTKLSKCARRIGFNQEDTSFSNTLFSNIRVEADADDEWEKNLRLLEAVGIVGCSTDYELPEISNETKMFHEIARDFDIESTLYAVMGAGLQSGWTPGCFADVGEHLNQTYDMPVLVVWQNESERQFAESVVQESCGAVFLAPPLSFLQFVAVARRASLFVGEETDFLYLATAADTPTIEVKTSGTGVSVSFRSNKTESIHIPSLETGRRSTLHTLPGMQNLRIDEYARDVMQVCHACDCLLKPLSFEVPENLLYEYVGA